MDKAVKQLKDLFGEAEYAHLEVSLKEMYGDKFDEKLMSAVYYVTHYYSMAALSTMWNEGRFNDPECIAYFVRKGEEV